MNERRYHDPIKTATCDVNRIKQSQTFENLIHLNDKTREFQTSSKTINASHDAGVQWPLSREDEAKWNKNLNKINSRDEHARMK